MKIVNNSGVPEPIYQFLIQEFYDKDAAAGTLSATTLLKPTQQILLTRRHDKEIEIDAMEKMWSVLGSGVHAVLEKIEGFEPVGRLYAELEGVSISGKPDFIHRHRICDYKVTSAFTLLYGSREKEWTEQISIYRYLYYKQTGESLDDIGEIVAILRDWSAKNIKPYYQADRYPKAPMVMLELPLLSYDATEELIRKKILEIKDAEALADKDLPLCTDEERWWNEKKQEYMRCAKYCEARAFCSQLKVGELI